jgi:hypothetical protein
MIEWHLFVELEREITLVKVVHPHVAILTSGCERAPRRIEKEHVDGSKVALVQLLAADMTAVNLVIEHGFKLTLTSGSCRFGCFYTTAANYKLVVRRLVAAVRGDGSGVQGPVALDGGEHVERVPAGTAGSEPRIR